MIEQMQEQGADCGIPDTCERVIPKRLVVLDNIPTLVLFLLGAALIWRIGAIVSVLFLFYCFVSIVLFWYLICPWCHHFGTRACPCGYGTVSSRLFQGRTGREFSKVFRRNIGIVFPCWILPFVAGAYLMWTNYNSTLLVLFASFCLIGFIAIPVISRFVGCKSCAIKDQCPWMSSLKN
jgi:hypothetical protein